MRRYTRLPRERQTSGMAVPEKRLLSSVGHDFLKQLFETTSGREVDWRYALYLFSDQEKGELLSDRFKQLAESRASYALIKRYFQGLTAADPLNRILEMEWNTQFPDQVLAFVDFLSMAHSVEVRSPFVDYRLAEFVAAVPGDMKIKNGIVKHILKESVGHMLPSEIVQRPKEGFVLPLYQWLIDKLMPFSRDMLSEHRLKKHGLLNPLAVRGILEDHYNGKQRNPAKIWALVAFQIWWELYFDSSA
jgi:asparagine synthase (glutamine-hydrolysing)